MNAVNRLVRLILFTALSDKVEKITFRLHEPQSQTGLRVTLSNNTNKRELPGMYWGLLQPIAVVLCNYASLPYYAKGYVTGIVTTERPSSAWFLESHDLQKELLLSMTQHESNGQRG